MNVKWPFTRSSVSICSCRKVRDIPSFHFQCLVLLTEKLKNLTLFLFSFLFYQNVKRKKKKENNIFLFFLSKWKMKKGQRKYNIFIFRFPFCISKTKNEWRCSRISLNYMITLFITLFYYHELTWVVVYTRYARFSASWLMNTTLLLISLTSATCITISFVSAM